MPPRPARRMVAMATTERSCSQNTCASAHRQHEVLTLVHMGLSRVPASFLLRGDNSWAALFAHHMMSKLAGSSAARPFSTEHSVRHFGQLSFFIPKRGRSISPRQPSQKVWPHPIIRGAMLSPYRCRQIGHVAASGAGAGADLSRAASSSKPRDSYDLLFWPPCDT